MVKRVIGDKYYIVNSDDTISIIRLTKIKNENSFVLVDEKTNEIMRLNKQELGYYTKLKPNGFINFSVVSLDQNMNDVIITLHRKTDMDNNNGIPYCICRQNVVDVFANIVVKNKIQFVGTSISIDTVPPDVQYNMFLTCNSIDSNQLVSIYIDDTLDKILSLVKKDIYDNIIKDLYSKTRDLNIQGYSNSLEGLMKDNNFMYDFLRAFDIHPVDFKVEIINEYNLHPLQVMRLEDELKVEMFETYVLKYDKEINLKDIKRKYIMVSDSNNELYIVAYDEGKYLNRYYTEKVRDKRDAIALLKYKKKYE